MLSPNGIRFSVKTLIFLLLLLGSGAGNLVFSQYPVANWSYRLGGFQLDGAECVVTDGSGNSYYCGEFGATVDFDPGAGVQNLTSAGSNDIFILKLNAAGQFVWVRRIGASTAEYALALALDNSGNIYVTGNFQGIVDFDPGTGVVNLTSAGGTDVYLLKLDNSGNFTWVKTFGGTLGEYPSSVAVGTSGNIVIGGSFQGTADFDPGAGIFNLTSAGQTDCFILKLDGTGNLLWAQSHGNTLLDEHRSLSLTSDEKIISTGTFGGTLDLDPGPGVQNYSSAGTNDIYIQSFSPAGNLNWVKTLGSTSYDFPYCVYAEPTGTFALSGSFNGTVDFNPGAGSFNLTSNGFGDIFALKWDTAGNFIWAVSAGGTGADYASDVTMDGAGNIYLSGQFQNTLDLNTGAGIQNATSAGNFDVFLIKLNAAGSFLWGGTLGGPGDDENYALIAGTSGNWWVGGFFEQTADINPNPGVLNVTSAGAEDFYLIKFGDCAASASSQSITACNSYTWPANNQTYSASGTYSHTLTNAAGCDSVLTLNLTINTPPPTPGFISSSNPLCLLQTGYFSVLPVAGATSYTWTTPPGWTIYSGQGSNAIMCYLATQSGSISVTANNSCGSSSPRNLFVTVTGTLGTLGPLSGPANFCAGSIATYSVPVLPNAQTYAWSIPAGWTVISGAGSNSLTLQTTSTGGTISVYAFNDCFNSNIISLNVTPVLPVGSSGAISGSTTFCSGGAYTYSIAAVSNATSYSWTLPAGWIINSGNNTNSISVTASSTSGTISVIAQNSCGTSPSTSIQVTLLGIPMQPGMISGPDTVCTGAAFTYSVAAVAGASAYQWNFPAGWTITSGGTTNIVNVTAGNLGGLITVQAANVCGISAPDSFTVTGLTVPAQPGLISGPDSICEGDSGMYSVLFDSTVTLWQWTIPAGFTGGSNTNSISVIAGSTGGTISVLASNQCGSSPPTQDSIFIYPEVTAAFSQSGAGMVYTFTDNSTGNPASWTWDFGDGAGSNSASPVHTFTNAGLYTICLIVTNNCGSDTSCTQLSILTGTEHAAWAGDLTLFPVPAGEMLYLSGTITTGELISLRITDLSGKVLIKKSITSGVLDEAFDLRNWSAGTYVIELENRESRCVKRFVVE